MTRWPIVLFVLAGLVVGGLGSASFFSSVLNDPSGAVEALPSDLALGERLYQAECAFCHGAELEGQPNWRQRNPDGTMPAPPHNDEGHTWHHTDAVLFSYTEYGGQETARRMGLDDVRSAMPAFGDQLSDEEIAAVLGYIKSTWSERSRQYQEALNRKAQEK